MKQLTKRQILQETLDMIAEHGRAIQDKDKGGSCVYRLDNHPGCALGRAILDDKYDSEMEGMDAFYIFDQYGDDLLSPEYRGHEINFWIYLQRLHDMPEYWSNPSEPTVVNMAGQHYINLLRFAFKIN